MSIQNRLKTFYEGLAALGIVNQGDAAIPCYHYFAPSGTPAPYIVWNEDSEDEPLMADNHKARQSIAGFVEYFTKSEFDSNFDLIQGYLDGFNSLSWTWEATQYGDPTNGDDDLIHHTWSWRMR